MFGDPQDVDGPCRFAPAKRGEEHLFLTEVDESGEPPAAVRAVAGESVADPQNSGKIATDRICLFKRGGKEETGRWHYSFDRYATP